MNRVRISDSIEHVDARRWDGLGRDPLSRHAVLRALESARLPGVTLRYVEVESRGRLEAAFPIATLDLDGEALTRGWFRRGIRTVRRANPGFMVTRLAICGTPLSVGNPPIRAARGADLLRVIAAAAGILGEFAEDTGARWRAFKEFDGSTAKWVRRVLPDWLLVPSEPAMEFEAPWSSFAEYLGCLRHPYRRRIHLALDRFRAGGGEVVTEPLEAFRPEMHALYEQVHDRAAVRLERLTPAFFRALGKALPGSTYLLRFLEGGRTVGWVCLLRDGADLHDLFHGIDYARNPALALYFNQVTAVLRHGLEGGVTRIHLGQSTGEAKARFGAHASPRWVAIRHRSRFLRPVLQAASPALFPEPVPPEFHVFRNGGPQRERVAS